MKYYTIYKITNKINGKIYIGKHETDNLDDDYMGSGKLIRNAIQKYGIENFEREILHILETEEEMNSKEAELVNESFVSKRNTYNLTCGGEGSWHHCKGKVTVKDNDGNYYKVLVTDPRYISGELVHMSKNMFAVRDLSGNVFMIEQDDPRYISGELVHISKNLVTVKDKDGNTLKITTNDPKYISGKLLPIMKDMVTVKDKDGNTFSINKNDPRYLSGELVYHWKGKKHTEKTKQKMRESQRGKQVGPKNSQYGKVWIHNLDEKRSTRVPKERLDEWLAKGWIRGRKMKF